MLVIRLALACAGTCEGLAALAPNLATLIAPRALGGAFMAAVIPAALVNVDEMSPSQVAAPSSETCAPPWA